MDPWKSKVDHSSRGIAFRAALLAAATAMASACGSSPPDEGGGDEGRPRDQSPARQSEAAAAGQPPELELVEVGRFDAPLDAVSVPGTGLVAVVEKGGRVIIASGMSCSSRDECPDSPVTEGDVVIDLRGDVSTGPEQGLLGLAFHPKWPDDDRIFINYTDPAGDTRIEAWRLDDPAGTARRERELLHIEQPFANHNGGHLTFGPDGLLYIGTGDGGAAGDPGDRAQQPGELLGKMLRIDVDAGGERGYGIPDGNLDDGADEVWGLGLRNPWRYSFDRDTGDLWIADVGQNEREEVNALGRSRLDGADNPNFGWRRREGFAEFDSSGRTGPGELVEPVLDYGRDHGCSITGGVVYRGELVPDLVGWYLFADFCQDDLRLLHADGVPGSDRDEGELEWTSVDGVEQVASFGESPDGEVLVVSLAGPIHQVVPAR